MRSRLTALAVAGAAIASCIGGGSAGAAECANEAFRVGAGALLPPCRAYEMVSPPQKNGGGVLGRFNLRVSPDGGSLGFYSTAAFGEPSGGALISPYISRRGSDSWITQNVEPPGVNSRGLFEFGAPGNSPDLTKTLQASRVALTPGATEGGSNLYLQDDLTGERQLVATEEGAELFEESRGFGGELAIDGTEDWSSLLFAVSQSLVPGAPTFSRGSNNRNLYEFRDGAVSLVSRLPATAEEPNGPPVTTVAAAAGLNPMSADGSRVTFVVGSVAGGSLYDRIDGRETIPVSASQRQGDEGKVFYATPGGNSADGSLVYFTTNADLVEGSETQGSSTVYRFDVATRRLTDMIPQKPAGGAQVGNFLAVSEDGGTAYFLADAVLAPGAKKFAGEGTNLYALRDGRIELVAALEEFNLPGTGSVSVSANGRFLAFDVATPIGEEAAEEAEEPRRKMEYEELEAEGKIPPCTGDNDHPGRCVDTYVFDADSGTVGCATCVRPAVANSIFGAAGVRGLSGPAQVRNVLDDGTVFVETVNALVPRDVNGVGDVYAWRAGTPGLISTGISDQPSVFANADPSGANAFFVTSQALVPSDTDNSFDAYDVRELGGLTSQFGLSAPAPCAGEDCQGASPAPLRPAPSGATTGESECAGVARAAGAARKGAGDLRRQAKAARKLAKRRQSAPNARRARRLAKRAKAAGKRANALESSVKTCQGGSR